ncbi:MAG: SDR family oxidoreductase [Clostridia bacterium]|nr:SDR family oxidoreductase [Clostridia bacterium]
MEINFNGKSVFLTGGSRGIGKAIKDRFIENGAEVAAPKREEMDLSDDGSVRKYIVKNSEYSPDIMVFNAGINLISPIEEIKAEDLIKTYQVNLFSSLRLISAFVKGQKLKGEGKIVFISSLYSMVSREGRLAYSSSKNAVTGAMKTLALELAPFNIMVNCIAPGYVMTEMTKKNLSGEEIESISRSIPTRRFQTEEEIADLTMFLCSDFNKSITGQLIAVDGGFLCR